MADADELPSPGPGGAGAETAAPATAGPGGFPVGGVGPGKGLDAPVPVVRDPADPLGPEKLRATELTVGQSIAFYNQLVRAAHVPGTEPGYQQVIAALVGYQSLYRDLNSLAEVRYDRSIRVRDMIARLDMGKLENITAYGDAAQAADSALLTWKRVFSTYQDIHRCLRGEDAQVAAAVPERRRLDDLPN